MATRVRHSRVTRWWTFSSAFTRRNQPAVRQIAISSASSWAARGAQAHRCVQGHGRASSFTQFLQEKNFIRSLNAVEIKSLSAKVKQIRCSSCGGPIDLEKDTACSHCGSAISVLDHDAVEKALESYRAKGQRTDAGGVAQTDVADAILRPSRPRKSEPYVYEAPASGGGPMADLVEVGIGILIASIFS
jgi:hypothetical protein